MIILLYFVLSAAGVLIAMRVSERVKDGVIGDTPLETGIQFFIPVILWPLLLLMIFVGYGAWLLGKGIERAFK